MAGSVTVTVNSPTKNEDGRIIERIVDLAFVGDDDDGGTVPDGSVTDLTRYELVEILSELEAGATACRVKVTDAAAGVLILGADRAAGAIEHEVLSSPAKVFGDLTVSLIQAEATGTAGASIGNSKTCDVSLVFVPKALT